MAYMEDEVAAQLSEFLGEGYKQFAELYNAKRDKYDASIFHQKCDNKGPTVTLIDTVDGHLFGGYTSISWISGIKAQHIFDSKAFLFAIKGNSALDKPLKFPIKEDRYENAVLQDEDSGPSFGCGPDLQTFEGRVQPLDSGEAPVQLKIEGEDYKHIPTGLSDVINSKANVKNIIVYGLKDSSPGLLSVPWRQEPKFDEKHFEKIKREVQEYSPLKKFGIENDARLAYINIVLVGQVGSGKSSYINTLDSAFRGHPSIIATAGSRNKSVTLDLRKYSFLNEDNRSPQKFKIWDTRGLGENFQLSKDFSSLCDGNIHNKHKFNIESQLDTSSDSYNRNPQLRDKVHCVVYTLDATAGIHEGVGFVPDEVLREMRSIQSIADQKGIPQLILLTKIEDASCGVTKNNLYDMFRSEKVHKLCIKAAGTLGLPPLAVMPMKNHFDECSDSRDINILALHNIRQMLRAADDYLRVNYLEEFLALKEGDSYKFPNDH